MSWFNTQPENDIDRGRGAVTYFHNDSCSFSSYGLKLDQMIQTVAQGGDPNRDPNGTAFLDSMGFAITSLEMSESQVRDAMQALANQYQGGIPRQSEFFSALSGRISKPTTADYIGGLPSIAADSAMDVVHGAQAVGDAVITTGKSLLVIGPLLVVAALVFIGYAKTRQIAGR